MSKKITALSYIGLVAITIIWGYAFVVVKNSIDNVPPIYMIAFRFTLASVGLIIIFHKKLKIINKDYIIRGGILGFFLFLAYVIQTVGIQYTTAGKNAFLTTAYVVIVPFLNWIILKKFPGKYSIAAAFIAIIGIGFLTLKNDLTVNIGDLLSLICGFGYAIHIIFVDKYTEKSDPILLTTLQLTFAAIFAWITAPLIEGDFPIAVFSTNTAISMIYLGIFSTMVALLLQNVCQKYTAPSTAALIMSLESVFGVFFSVIILGEIISPSMIIGCVLILTAIIISETKLKFIKKKSYTIMK